MLSSEAPGSPGIELGALRRSLLSRAQLMLIFTPQACGSNRPMEALERVLDAVDVIQVRPKVAEGSRGSRTRAADAADWTRRVLALRDRCAGAEARGPLVIVNDRADVARTLLDEGCDGVHLGQDDAPPGAVRALLGPDALIGLSTHDAPQVVLAGEEPVDYLGFGPIFPTATKGYADGLGTERAWVAAEASSVPVFPIGGIDLANVDELAQVGRVAVCSAILAAEAPDRAARALRAQLTA